MNFDWATKEQELVQYFTENIHNFIAIYERTKSFYKDFLFSLIPHFEFLKFSAIALASLHIDYLANPTDFHASEFSLTLFNIALSKTSTACSEVTKKNFEALFFATTFIMACSYRLTDTIPLYSNGPEQVDILSLCKGPISLIMSMKDHLSDSPLMAEFMHNSHAFELQVETKLCDNLLQVCSILSDDGYLEQDLKSLLSVLRTGPASPPADEAIFMDENALKQQRGNSVLWDNTAKKSIGASSVAKGNPFLTRESLMYFRMNPTDPDYMPERVCNKITAPTVIEDFDDGLRSASESDEVEYYDDGYNTASSNDQRRLTSESSSLNDFTLDSTSNSHNLNTVTTPSLRSPSVPESIGSDITNISLDFKPQKFKRHTPSFARSKSTGSTGMENTPLLNNRESFVEVLTVLRIAVRKVVAIGNFSRIHVWPMLLNRQFLTLLRVERHPFALITLCYYFCMVLFHDLEFWLKDRMFNEIRAILYGNMIPPEWMALLEWPKMVLEMAEKRVHEDGSYEPLSLEMFKRIINEPI